MTIKFSGTIDVNDLLNRIFSFLSRSWASRLVLLGVGLMSVDFPSLALYAFQTVILKREEVVPPGNFGWLELVGLALVIIGILASFLGWVTTARKSKAEERTKFKESYGQLSDVRLQDELHRLYRVRDADVRAIKAILSHPSNVNFALEQFQSCYRNVVFQGPWFALRGRWFKLRYNVGFLLLVLVILHGLSCLLLAAVEFHKPGILRYGPQAAHYFLAIAILVGIGAFLVFSDIQKMGTAITLVEKAHPRAS